MVKNKKLIFLILISGVFLGLGILRLNDLSMYTDSTRYLIWGNSVAHGKGFVDDTQPEPEYYIVNAPFFSVLLAPILVVFPLSLIAAKIWTLLWGILALILFYRWLSDHLGQTPALATTLFFALNPMTLVLTTEVLSEASFLCIIFGTILLIERIEKNDAPRWMFVVLIFILSFIILIREVGIALVAAAFLFLLFRKKRTIALTIAFFTSFLFGLWTYRNLGMIGAPESSQNPNLIFILQHFVTSPDTTLFYEITQRVSINLKGYTNELVGTLLYLFPFNLIVDPFPLFGKITTFLNAIRIIIVVFFLPPLAVGVILDTKKFKGAIFRLLFLSFYLCIIFVYPVQDVRFLFPLLPFAVYYLAIVYKQILENIKLSSSLRRSLAWTFIVIALFPNLICIFEILRTNLFYLHDPIDFSKKHTTLLTRTGYYSTPWKLMGEWIDREIPKGVILASPSKEIVPFTPGHKFLELNRAVPLPMFETLLRDNAVEYLLAPTIFDSLTEYQTMIDESPRFRFERLYSISRLNLFRVYPRLEEPAHIVIPTKRTFNLENNSDLLRLGRLALRCERYPDALFLFTTLQNRFPHFSDILYQRLLVHTFMLDSIQALQRLQEIYTSPTATSYIAPALLHIHAMNLLLQAQLIHNSIIKTERLYEVARLYWDLGYQQQAYHISQQIVQIDSAFFIGLLWSWHYGIQVGDTMHVQRYLQQLEQIDHQNLVVKSFRTMTSLHGALNQTHDREKRTALRLALSHEYDKIDLPDEALDEAQRAIGEDSTSTDAWKALITLFEKKKQPLAATRARAKLHAMEIIQTTGNNR